MSILIKGIKMPTHCMDCPFMVSRDNDDCILQSDEANEGFENWEQMKDGCPLVPVPPHGRLIDANALDDAFTNLRWTTGDYKTGELAHWGARDDWCLKGQEVDELINSAPTIIEKDGEG